MNKLAQLGGVCLLGSAIGVHAVSSPPPWRFGIEDTWAFFGGILNPVAQQQLLSKMATLMDAQPQRGDVNINGFAGGWNGMQPTANSTINFTQSDGPIQTLQAQGFSVLWNLRLNAVWSSADNPDCYQRTTVTNCAPDAAHEEDLKTYVRAFVERYDGDGDRDMGHETPLDVTDDLTVPVRFILMDQEVEFAGAVPMPSDGYGDAATNHFWSDSIANLIRTHRLVSEAVAEADPSGNTKIICSGGVFWDLYSDFPDWPEIEGTTVQQRLNGQNNHNATYQRGFNDMKQLLTGASQYCDYLGWHPHMSWRDIDQSFAFLRAYGGNKPIYVDDMWSNLFLSEQQVASQNANGNTLFTGGGVAIEGDFPNAQFTSYPQLWLGVNQVSSPARDWYYARHSRTLVKAFASAFGEGAERVSVSGIADIGGPLRLGITGHLNLLDTVGTNFAEKPAWFTYQMLVEKLQDFTSVEELDVSADPRTRAYRFERPRGPVIVAWSETGAAPPGLDYRVDTGQTVTLALGFERVLRTRPVTSPGQSQPDTEFLVAPGGQLALRLGYEPALLEADDDVLFVNSFE